jgi:hypothetical protein
MGKTHIFAGAKPEHGETTKTEEMTHPSSMQGINCGGVHR